MTTQQGLRQASFRTISGNAGTYNGDAIAAFETEAIIEEGDTFDQAFGRWLRARNRSTTTNLPMLMQEFADDAGAHNWASVGSFSAATWVKAGESTFTLSAGAGATDVDLPGLPAEDDIVLVLVGCDFSLSTSAGLSDAGYTILESDAGPGRELGYKIMGASPDSTVEITGEDNRDLVGIIQIWRGVDTSTPIDDTKTEATGASGMPNPPSFTTVTNNALVLAVGVLDDDEVASSVTAPAGYIDLVAASTSAGGEDGATVMLATKIKATAGAEDPAVFGGDGSDDWWASTFALRPA